MQSEAAENAGRFRPDIQGLRAIAVSTVVLYHAGVPFLRGGYVGVDVFFVISGFLITGHLLREIAQDGKFSFGAFYARRIRRLLPAALVVLVLSSILAWFLMPPLLLSRTYQDALATAFYLPNMLFAFQGTNYLAEATPSLFQHYWSLGVEEQFYLLWPVALVALSMLKSRRALLLTVAGVTLVSFVACVWLTYVSQPWAFFSLPTRAWEFGVGGLLVIAGPSVLRRTSARVATTLAWLGLAALVVTPFIFSERTTFPGYWAAVPVIATAIVLLFGASGSTRGPARLLGSRPMVFIGLISYSLYLIHWPALVLPEAAAGYFNPLPLWATLAIACACVPAAWLLYKFVESPARKWNLSSPSRRTLFSALAATLIVAVLAFAGTRGAAVRPLSSDQTAAPPIVAVYPEGTGYVPSNLTPSLAQAAGDHPETYDDGCHLDYKETSIEGCSYGSPGRTEVALFGDSHATQWFPGLKLWAESEGYTLTNYTKSSCPSTDIEVEVNNVPYTECTYWRDATIAQLKTTSPDLVILANYYHSPESSDPTSWKIGLQSTIDRLDGLNVAILADSPYMFRNPSICLSAHLTDSESCARPPSSALQSTIRDAESLVAAENGLAFVDMDDYFCSTDICPPIIGNIAVYRDPHHITSVFSEHLAVVLGEKFEPLIVR